MHRVWIRNYLNPYDIFLFLATFIFHGVLAARVKIPYAMQCCGGWLNRCLHLVSTKWMVSAVHVFIGGTRVKRNEEKTGNTKNGTYPQSVKLWTLDFKPEKEPSSSAAFWLFYVYFYKLISFNRWIFFSWLNNSWCTVIILISLIDDTCKKGNQFFNF